jgi:hypothetical protein
MTAVVEITSGLALAISHVDFIGTAKDENICSHRELSFSGLRILRLRLRMTNSIFVAPPSMKAAPLFVFLGLQPDSA